MIFNIASNINVRATSKRFLDKISAQQWLIFVKEFYIIVPYYSSSNDNSMIKNPRRQKLLMVLETQEWADKIVAKYRGFIKQRKFLDVRTSVIMEWLRGIGLTTERIGMSSIVSLLFSSYNPAVHVSQAEFVS